MGENVEKKDHAIKNHALNLLVERASTVSLGMSVLREDFIVQRPVHYSSLMSVHVCVDDTHFHLVCELPCEPNLAPCQGLRQTLKTMTGHEKKYKHNNNEY